MKRIESQVQYESTRGLVKQFEAALAALDGATPSDEMPARLLNIRRAAAQSTLEELRAQLSEYEARSSSKRGAA